MHKQRSFFSRAVIALCAVGSLVFLSSCEEKISALGTDYLRDTVIIGANSLGGNSLMTETPIAKRTMNALGRTYTYNYSSPYLFIGRVPEESLESWVILRSPLVSDSIGTVEKVEIVLPMRFNYLYGDASNASIDITVYSETNNKATDSTGSLTMADLSAVPLGSVQTTVEKDSLKTITIGLSTEAIPLLKNSSVSFVLVPNQTMTNIRGLSSNENGDVNFAPTFRYYSRKAGDTALIISTRNPAYDYHLATEQFTAPQGTFYLRGTTSQRERLVINTKLIRETLSIDALATINSSILQLTSEPALYKTSVIPTDTSGPALVLLNAPNARDSAYEIRAYGVRSASLPNVWEFQVHTVIEEALRSGSDSLVFELQTGYANRLFGSVQNYVDDFNFVRWVFYGVNASEEAKRPRVAISYSRLQN